MYCNKIEATSIVWASTASHLPEKKTHRTEKADHTQCELKFSVFLFNSSHGSAVSIALDHSTVISCNGIQTRAYSFCLLGSILHKLFYGINLIVIVKYDDVFPLKKSKLCILFMISILLPCGLHSQDFPLKMKHL